MGDGTGTPDADDLTASADTFALVIDDPLSRAPTELNPAGAFACGPPPDGLGRGNPDVSHIEHDIDRPKHYGINLGGARRVLPCGMAGEKLRMRLSMPGRDDVTSRFKARIGDGNDRCGSREAPQR